MAMMSFGSCDGRYGMPTPPDSTVAARLAVISLRKDISRAMTAFCTLVSAPGNRISASTRR